MITLQEVNALDQHQISSQWKFTFTRIPGINNSLNLTNLNNSITEAVMPGWSIDPIIHENKGTTTEMPGKIQYERDMNIIMVDNQAMDNWQKLYAWGMYIRNWNSKSGSRTLYGPNGVTADARLAMFWQDRSDSIAFNVLNVWLANMPSIPLNGQAQFIEMQVGLKFQRFEPDQNTSTLLGGSGSGTAHVYVP